MKHLFFVAIVASICSGVTLAVKAQSNVGIEKVNERTQKGKSPRFIEGIELRPEATLAASPVTPLLVVQTSETTVGKDRPIVLLADIEQTSSLQFKYALLMDREVESINDIKLYSFIEDWWATKYRYGGKDRNGIDCSAFTEKLLYAVYGKIVDRTAKDQYNNCIKLVPSALEEGDLVFFNTRGGVSHVGIYLGENYFVHSSVQNGVTISSLTDNYYNKKFITGGRLVTN